jgi:hypothetical protein
MKSFPHYRQLDSMDRSVGPVRRKRPTAYLSAHDKIVYL